MKTTNHQPRVSIGLAVYNGEKYLEKAIDSILSQTYSNFELIISDNASTDRTAEICKRYAAQDQRIRYSRNSNNIGGANNENLTFRLARGEYFQLAAHDDMFASDLIRQCVNILDNNPDVVLCYSQSMEIDENDTCLQIISNPRGISNTPNARLAELGTRKHRCEAMYGLIRSEVLGRTQLQKNYTDSDRTLLCELGLYGRFYQIPEPLFLKRLHAENVYVDWRTRMAWFNSANAGKIVFPFWMQFVDFVRVLYCTPLPGLEKILCILTYTWLFITEYFLRMVKDVVIAFYMLLHSRTWRLERYNQTNNWMKNSE